MYKIKLTGELNQELRTLGCKPGDRVLATFQRSNQSMWFHTTIYGHTIQCVVYPDNYEIITDPTPKKTAEPVIKYFAMITPGVSFEKRDLKNEIAEFTAKYNHCIISDRTKFILDLKTWCNKHKVMYDEFAERNSFFADKCFMVQLIEIKTSNYELL